MKKAIFMLGIVSAILAGCESDEKIENQSEEMPQLMLLLEEAVQLMMF